MPKGVPRWLPNSPRKRLFAASARRAAICRAE